MADEVKKVKKVLKEFEKKEQTSKQLKSFTKASEQFDQLVEAGVIEKRGNRQLSIDQAHLNTYSLNTRLHYSES